jgi:hypothetical protein
MKDLLACRETRSRPVADIEEGHVSTAACILANISMTLGRSLEWDHEKGGGRRGGEPLACPYRAPWHRA